MSALFAIFGKSLTAERTRIPRSTSVVRIARGRRGSRRTKSFGTIIVLQEQTGVEMLKWAGKQAVEGAIQKIGESGPKIGTALKSAFEGALKAPGLNIPPLLWKIMSEVPEYWDNLPGEQKQALFNALVAAGTKAAMSYATKGS